MGRRRADKRAEELAFYFRYSAALRIFGGIGDLDAITATLGVEPTYTHRRGDQRTPRSVPWEHDMWMYQAEVPEDRPLSAHLDALWRAVQPHVTYLKGLRERLSVDVYCNYGSNCGTAGFEIGHHSLAIFTALEVPLGVAVMVG